MASEATVHPGLFCAKQPPAMPVRGKSFSDENVEEDLPKIETRTSARKPSLTLFCSSSHQPRKRQTGRKNGLAKVGKPAD